MECPKCKQFNVPAENCGRCNAPLRAKPMHIVERVYGAIRTYQSVSVMGVTLLGEQNASVSDGLYDIPQPNVIYVGEVEYLEIRKDMRCTLPRERGGFIQFMGLNVIEVRLAEWLQVTYVDGEK